MIVHDINTCLGRSMLPVSGQTASTEEFLAAMDKAGISESLVWHVAQHELSPGQGNKMLSASIVGQSRLHGCWTLLPPQTNEVITADFFSTLSAAGIRALRAMPLSHGYQLRRATFNRFFDELSERRVPLLLSLEHGITWPLLYDFLNDYPEAIVVICDVGIWGQDREFWPLLERYPGVAVETSLVSLEAGGLAAGVDRFGASRFLFGSGFPARYAEAALLDLLNADISAHDKSLIAQGNMERLMIGVKG